MILKLMWNNGVILHSARIRLLYLT